MSEAVNLNDTTNGNDADDAENLTNDARLNDYLKDMGKYGREDGVGSESPIKAFIRTVRAAQDKVLPEDPKGTKPEDKFMYGVYERYEKNCGKKRAHPMTKASKAVQVNKLNTARALGENEKVDGESIMDRAKRILEDAVESGRADEFQSTYNAYVAVGRKFKDAESDPSDDEIAQVMRNKEPKDKTVKDILIKIAKELEKLMTAGEGGRADGIFCDKQEVQDAHASLSTLIATFTLADKLDELAEMGVDVSALRH